MPEAYWRKLRWSSWLGLCALLIACSFARCEEAAKLAAPAPTKTFRF